MRYVIEMHSRMSAVDSYHTQLIHQSHLVALVIKSRELQLRHLRVIYRVCRLYFVMRRPLESLGGYNIALDEIPLPHHKVVVDGDYNNLASLFEGLYPDKPRVLGHQNSLGLCLIPH